MKRVPIKGFEGYEIDNMGNVYIPTRTITVYDHGRIYNRTFKSRVTKGSKSSNGYYRVTLYNGTAKKQNMYTGLLQKRLFLIPMDTTR